MHLVSSSFLLMTYLMMSHEQQIYLQMTPCKLFISISSHEDYLKPQDDLNRLVEWSQKWQVGFNEAKCNVLHLGSTNPYCYEYSMRNTSLEAITEEKDLGVTIDRDLKFHMHVSKVVNKVSIILGLVRATFTCIDVIHH